jgi:hypothetical protein
MASSTKPAFGLFAVLLVALAAGCGGSGGSTSTSTGTSTTPAASIPATTTPDKGFTQAQWKHYQTTAATFKTLNTATLTKVAACAKTAGHAAGHGVVEKCVGNSLTQLSAATKTLGATLAGLANSVGGSCQTALGALINYVVPYQASLASLQNTISTGNAAAVTNSVSSLQLARSGGQEKAAAVAQVCAP